MANQQQSDIVHISGLWTETSKNGTSYLKGSIKERVVLEPGNILVFKNQYAGENSKKPSHKIAWSPKRQRPQQSQQQSDDIPF